MSYSPSEWLDDSERAAEQAVKLIEEYPDARLRDGKWWANIWTINAVVVEGDRILLGHDLGGVIVWSDRMVWIRTSELNCNLATDPELRAAVLKALGVKT